MHFTSKWERRNDGRSTAAAPNSKKSKQRQRGKSGVCNVLHLTGVGLGAIPWMLPCNAKPLSCRMSWTTTQNQGGVRGCEGTGVEMGQGLRRRGKGRLHEMIWFLTGARKERERGKSRVTRGRSDSLLDIKTGLFPPRLPNCCSFLDQISSPHFLRSPTRLGFVPNDHLNQPPSAALTGLSPGLRTHNHTGTTHTKTGSNPSRRFFGSFLSFLYKLLPPPHLVILRPFSFCTPEQRNKLEINRSTTHTRSFTTASG